MTRLLYTVASQTILPVAHPFLNHRIDPNGPYSKGNCRLVSAYINIAMNQFGEKLLVYAARAIAKKQAEDTMDALL